MVSVVGAQIWNMAIITERFTDSADLEITTRMLVFQRKCPSPLLLLGWDQFFLKLSKIEKVTSASPNTEFSLSNLNNPTRDCLKEKFNCGQVVLFKQTPVTTAAEAQTK